MPESTPPTRTRSPEELQREIAGARDNLAARLSMLEHKMRETVDVRARARMMAARAKLKAYEGALAAKEKVRDGAIIARDEVRAHPARYGAIAAAVVLGIYVAFRLRGDDDDALTT